MSRRVVITGLGTVNPLGNNVETTWDNVKKGGFRLVVGVGSIHGGILRLQADT